MPSRVSSAASSSTCSSLSIRLAPSGGGGGGLEDAAPQRTWFNLHFQRAFHYCYAAIHERTIVFKAYDINGLLFDTFELTKADDR